MKDRNKSSLVSVFRSYIFYRGMKTFKAINSWSALLPPLNRVLYRTYMKAFRVERIIPRVKVRDLEIAKSFIHNPRSNKRVVLIDAQCLQSGSFERGIGRYSREFLIALASANQNEEFVLLLNNFNGLENIHTMVGDLPPNLTNLKFYLPDADIFKKHENLAQVARTLTDEVLGLNLKSILFLSLFEHPYNVIRLDISRLPKTFALYYDLIPLEFPQWFMTSQAIQAEYQENLTRLLEIDVILAISETSAATLRDRCERVKDVYVIGGAGFSGSQFIGEDTTSTRRGVLCIASNSPHKNAQKLIEGYSMLPLSIRLEHNLIILGVSSSAEKQKLRLLAMNLGCNVTLLDFISDQDLAQLYSTCKLNISPSFSEGLGMPILEAWNYGCVSLGSTNTSLSEILNEGSVTFDPKSAISINEILYRYLTNDRIWQNEKNRIEIERVKHSWISVAKKATRILFSVS